MVARPNVPIVPNVPSPPAFLEDERNVLDPDFDAIDWALLGVRPIWGEDEEADLDLWA